MFIFDQDIKSIKSNWIE